MKIPSTPLRSPARRRLLVTAAAGVTAAMAGCATPQTPRVAQSTFVLVHGAWHGGWCWRRVANALGAQGHRVYTPTLTGLGERSHLLSPAIGLGTHVDDVVNLLKWEELDNVVLCGHSYGGMVITGVVEALPQRVRSLVYLDALVPDANRSLLDYSGPALRARFNALAQGNKGALAPIPAKAFMVNEKDQAWVDAKCTAHPYKTFEESLPKVTARDAVPRKTYVFAAKYNSALMSGFAAPRRSDAGWKVIDLPFGHDLMVDAPANVTDILLDAQKS